jgi:osmotically-inducible protein OsmY
MTNRKPPGWSPGLQLAVLTAVALVALPVLAATRPGDESIDDWVKFALRDDPRVDASAIVASVDDGVVTLRGSVKDLAAKRFALDEARKLSGVRAVIDDLSVEPDARSDLAISADVVARLWGSPDLGPKRLDVDVKDGVVTLRGTVDSWSEKQEAELLASEVRSVREVRNELAMQYESIRPDDEIRSDVVAAIGRDAYLSGLPIDVKVREGKVTLTGSVGTAYQRERAATDAWVANVRGVKNDLDVAWWEDRGVRKTMPLPSDEATARAVHDVLYQDLHVEDPFSIHVDASAGDVTLRGTVPTFDQKLRATSDSKGVVGVVWVNDRLVVRPSWRSDAAIRKDVLARLDEDYLTHGSDVGVAVRDGVVTLAGTLDSYRERRHAVRVVGRVPGVVDVEDHVRVEWTPRFSDDQIQERIEQRLQQDAETRWVGDRVEVHVEDGVARLTGDVFSWDERLEAARVAAVTDGVRWVDNRITVEGVDYPWDEWYLPGGPHGWYALSPP